MVKVAAAASSSGTYPTASCDRLDPTISIDLCANAQQMTCHVSNAIPASIPLLLVLIALFIHQTHQASTVQAVKVRRRLLVRSAR